MDKESISDLREDVRAYAVKARGANDHEIEDIVQDVMVIAMAKINLYSPEKGSIKAWLLTITRNRVIDNWRKRRPEAMGTMMMTAAPGVNESGLNLDVCRELLTEAEDAVKCRFKARTWELYELTKSRSPREVSKETGTSAAGIYVARSRVLRRIKGWIKRNRADVELRA